VKTIIEMLEEVLQGLKDANVRPAFLEGYESAIKSYRKFEAEGFPAVERKHSETV